MPALTPESDENAWEVGAVIMKYVTDANISGLAKELRSEGIDCETVHKLMVNNEDSRVTIKDPQIVKYLRNRRRCLGRFG